MKQEEIKKEKNKSNIGCWIITCIICIILSPFIIGVVIGFVQVTGRIFTDFLFIRPKIEGKVIDKETGRPISHALIKTYFLSQFTDYRPLEFAERTILSDEKGNYKIGREFILEVPKTSGEIPGLPTSRTKRVGQVLTCWFPGYKKYEIQTEGRKLISGRHDIYLERPKTAEEAVEELESWSGLRKSIEMEGILPRGFGPKEIDEKMKKEGYKTYLQLIWNIFIENDVKDLANPYVAQDEDETFRRIMYISQTKEVREEFIKQIPCERLSDKMRNKCYEFKKNYKSKWR